MTAMRKLGSLETPPLILGGNVFGWTIDETTSFAVLDAYVAGGGVMIDTADVYSAWVGGHKGGESESIIGAWLKHRGKRDDVMITTKVGMLPGAGGEKLAPARIAAAIDESLQRLGTDYIDLYLAHQDDTAHGQDAVAEAFDALVKAGKVREIGASNFSADRLASALAAQEKAGTAPYVALQNKYNLLERGDYEGAVQDFCVENGIAMTPFYGLANGYLSGKYRAKGDGADTTRGSRVQKFIDGEGPIILAAMDEVAADTGASLAQIALAWLAAQPGIAAPITSATSTRQVEDLVGAMNLTLLPAHLALLDTASAPAVAET